MSNVHAARPPSPAAPRLPVFVNKQKIKQKAMPNLPTQLVFFIILNYNSATHITGL
jgi:hypothetical protein